MDGPLQGFSKLETLGWPHRRPLWYFIVFLDKLSSDFWLKEVAVLSVRPRPMVARRFYGRPTPVS